MFSKIFIEKDVQNNIYAQNILSKLGKIPHIIDRYDQYWGKVHKPYLEKRANLDLYIAKKRGVLVKETPDAYGTKDGKHFYFVHAYNCIYECEYCYLQGYFKTPDIVLFVNHDEIILEMEKILLANPNDTIWFHAGEFSDSLALSHLSGEFEIYWKFFQKYPKAKLELRTKSVNITSLLKMQPLDNIIVSFSLSPNEQNEKHDLKTPKTKSRNNAILKLTQKGFKIGIHFDPIIYHQDFKKNYETLITELEKVLPSSLLAYVSIGVVRFTKEVFEDFKKNYPESEILSSFFVKSFDDKIRYSRPTRGFILKTIEDLFEKSQYGKSKVYRCME